MSETLSCGCNAVGPPCPHIKPPGKKRGGGSGDLADAQREVRRLRKHLTEAVECMTAAFDALDVVGPAAGAHGKRLAAIANALEMGRDMASHFGLGRPPRKARS